MRTRSVLPTCHFSVQRCKIYYASIPFHSSDDSFVISLFDCLQVPIRLHFAIMTDKGQIQSFGEISESNITKTGVPMFSFTCLFKGHSSLVKNCSTLRMGRTQIRKRSISKGTFHHLPLISGHTTIRITLISWDWLIRLPWGNLINKWTNLFWILIQCY